MEEGWYSIKTMTQIDATHSFLLSIRVQVMRGILSLHKFQFYSQYAWNSSNGSWLDMLVNFRLSPQPTNNIVPFSRRILTPSLQVTSLIPDIVNKILGPLMDFRMYSSGRLLFTYIEKHCIVLVFIVLIFFMPLNCTVHGINIFWFQP